MSVVFLFSVQTEQVRDRQGRSWCRPPDLDTLLRLLAALPPGTQYKLCAGNTGRGVLADPPGLSTYLDIAPLPELLAVTREPLSLGGGVSITDAAAEWAEAARTEPARFSYLVSLCQQLEWLASPAVRDRGTVAGNLMLKHRNPEFQSDMFTLLEAVGAELTVVWWAGGERRTAQLSPRAWLDSSMSGRLLLAVTLPPLPATRKLLFYKVGNRTAFTHAQLNAAFLYELKPGRVRSLASRPSLVFGGVAGSFIHAQRTEEALLTADLRAVGEAGRLARLAGEEAGAVVAAGESGTQYRLGLVMAITYKFLLAALPGVSADCRTGAGDLRLLRPLQSGSQRYTTDPAQFPVTEPVEKLEVGRQCSGKAQYCNDIPLLPGELHAALVLTSQASCQLDTVDPSPALALPGVVAFIDHTDIPGQNNLTGHKKFAEPLFVSNAVSYAGQAVGLVLAESSELAHTAASLVRISYKNKESLRNDSSWPFVLFVLNFIWQRRNYC